MHQCPFCGSPTFVCHCRSRSSNYGCFGFFGDIVMTGITGGLWLIYIFVREMRKNRRGC